MPAIQISLDIATSISVIVAAIGFLLSHLRNRKASRQRRRTEAMADLISGFAKILVRIGRISKA